MIALFSQQALCLLQGGAKVIGGELYYEGKYYIHGMKRKWLWGIVAVTTIFAIAELALQGGGYLPGVMLNSFAPVHSIISEPVHTADSLGITTYLPGSPYLPPHYSINQQGFIGSFNYTAQVVDSLKAADSKKAVMLIGDSYAEGCCVDSPSLSFAGLLSQTYTVLNFGVGATDPAQYHAIAAHYVPLLKPHAVVVTVYLGNDVMNEERPLHPGIPVCYRTANAGWCLRNPTLVCTNTPGSILKTYGRVTNGSSAVTRCCIRRQMRCNGLWRTVCCYRAVTCLGACLCAR